ncbi:TPA: hypothetical protein ACH3X1_003082 [Trebouxia sp. C0004]
MKSELDNLGFKDIEDYGDMEWGTFKIEHPEVRHYIKPKCKAKVLTAFSLKEDRLQGVKILCEFWHNHRKKHVENLKAEQEALAAAVDIILACNGQYQHINDLKVCNAADDNAGDGRENANNGAPRGENGDDNAGQDE